MPEPKTTKRRVYQVAKELNISHNEIIEFLQAKDIECKNHMSPISEKVYEMVLEEFAKEKDIIERYRKEKARKELELARRREEELREAMEKERAQLNTYAQRLVEKSLPSVMIEIDLLTEYVAESLKPQVSLPKPEKKPVIEIPDKEITEKEGEPESVEGKAEKEAPRKKKRKRKKGKKLREDILNEIVENAHPSSVRKGKKMRRIDIAEIEAKLEQKIKRRKRGPDTEKGDVGKKKEIAEVDEKKIEASIKRTMAKMDEKSRRRKKYKKSAKGEIIEEEETNKLKISEFITVEELANLMDVDPTEVIQKCIGLGLFVTINQRLDLDTVVLIADEFGYEVEQVVEYGEEVLKIEDTEEDIKKARPRAPVITVMGHVDHGKTSLLDYIRETNVVAGEKGQITQHIGAYRVKYDDREITFLDTPGHAAFTSMRARGAQITDIVVLVVAADDSVMPQTIEAINHAKAASVPLIIAINKIDKPAANPDRVRRELADLNILVEDWGGKYQVAEISAKTGQGINDLMEKILLEADVLELKSNYDTLARGTVLESELSKGYGPIATVLIQKGTLRVGDPFVCGETSGKVRALLNERAQKIEKAVPSVPVQVLGFSDVPQVGDIFAAVEDEKEARKIGMARARIRHERQMRRMQMLTLDQLSQQIARGEVKELPIIIKGDVDGSVEAVYDSINELNTEEVSINIIHHGTGLINESDVLLASASNAVIIGFHVAPTAKAVELAKQENVEMRQYYVIYDIVNDLKLTLEGLLEPEIVEESLGEAEVRMVIKVPKIGQIAGCYVTSGKILRNSLVKIKRNGEMIHQSQISSLKRFKEDVKEVSEGFECGIGVEDFHDFVEGDIIYAYEEKKLQRTLK